MSLTNLEINEILFSPSTKDFYIVIGILNKKTTQILLLDTQRALHIVSEKNIIQKFQSTILVEKSFKIFSILSDIYLNKKWFIDIQILNTRYIYSFFQQNIYMYIITKNQTYFYVNNFQKEIEEYYKFYQPGACKVDLLYEMFLLSFIRLLQLSTDIQFLYKNCQIVKNISICASESILFYEQINS